MPCLVYQRHGSVLLRLNALLCTSCGGALGGVGARPSAARLVEAWVCLGPSGQAQPRARRPGH